MKKYIIELDGCVNVGFETDSPKEALDKWLLYCSKRVCMAQIKCGSHDDCLKLYRNFISRCQELYREFWVYRGTPINFYLLERRCFEYLEGRKLEFNGNKKSYDVVPLFSYWLS